MKHDTIAVHKFMSVILPQIKQILQICSHAITLAMVQALNIKTTKTLPTFAITKLTLECMLSGIFLLVVMEKVLVMASVALWSVLLLTRVCKSYLIKQSLHLMKCLISVKKTSLISVSFMFLHMSKSILYW